MFGKLYKEANDEIPVNTELMEKLKAEAASGRKKNHFTYAYRYGYAAAAILLVTVSLSVMPKLEADRQEDNSVPPIETRIVKTPENETPKAAETAGTSSCENVAEKSDTAKNNPPINVKESAENVVGEGENNPTAGNGSDITATAEPIEVQSEEAVPNSRMSGHEPSPTSLGDVAVQSVGEAIPTSEYPEWFGSETAESILSNGLNFVGGDENTVYCAGEDKSMKITFYPNGEDVQKLIDMDRKENAENCIFEEKGEDELTAYVIKGKEGYVIESQGIEKEEISVLVGSIG